jgi:hypothetical protein
VKYLNNAFKKTLNDKNVKNNFYFKTENTGSVLKEILNPLVVKGFLFLFLF